MTTYDKPKRKNQPLPANNIFSMLASFVRGLGYYGLVVPLRWMWQLTQQVLGWSWSLTKWLVAGSWRQLGKVLSWAWRITSSIFQKLVIAPLVMLGRLLGFVPNAIPEGLSSVEVEVYQRIGRQFRRRKRWYLHILIFLIAMTTLWLSESYNYYNPSRTGALIAITISWLLILGGHRLWMNLGKSEDQEIGEELNRIRHAQSTTHHENEHYDTSHLEDHQYDRDEWIDEQAHLNSQYNRD